MLSLVELQPVSHSDQAVDNRRIVLQVKVKMNKSVCLSYITMGCRTKFILFHTRTVLLPTEFSSTGFRLFLPLCSPWQHTFCASRWLRSLRYYLR